MTEEQWLACEAPREMLTFLRGKTSNRKLRFFVCAWCRRFFGKILNRQAPRRLLETAELYADDLVDKNELSAARRAFNRVRWSLSHAGTWRALNAVWWAAFGKPIESVFEMQGIQPHRTTMKLQANLLRDIFYPFQPDFIASAWLSWNNGIVVRLAQAAYDERILPAGTLDNTRLFILADALEEAGCTDEQILTHLRSGGEHYRGCWVIDMLLGKS